MLGAYLMRVLRWIPAPLVGAIYEKRFAPIGLCLAIAGNALGTYLGLLSAALARLVVK